jgi:NADH-quinone oxidoreductase subunit M
MTDFLNDWGLTLATFIPVVGALAVLAVPKGNEVAIKAVALLASLATFLIAMLLLIDFDYDAAGELQYTVDKGWIDVINSRYIMALDGISLPLLALTLLVVPLCIIYSWNHLPEPGKPKAFFSLLLILETGMVGTFLAQDLILFFVFFEVVLLPMYFMIGVWGGPNRQYAAIKFFLFTLFGSALMLVSFLALYFLGAETFDIRALPAAAEGIAETTQLWIFGGMFLASASRSRCSRSTPGCPTPTPRPPPWARSSWLRCC